MSSKSGKKFNLNSYKKDYNKPTSQHRQNFRNPEANATVINSKRSNTIKLDDVDLLPADNDFEVQNIYIINNEPDDVSHLSISINHDEFALKDGFSFANIGMANFKQVYKFDVNNPADLELMKSTPKVVVTSQNQTYMQKGRPLNFYKIFLIAPELYTNKNPELRDRNLPVLYALDVIYRPENPNMFRITLQAIVGGCGDGLYNLMMLDCNDFEDNEEHELLGPHVHTRTTINAKLMQLHRDRKVDTIGQEYSDFKKAIGYMLEQCGIHHSMTTTLRGEKVKDVCESLVGKDGKLKTTSEAPIKTITAQTVFNSKDAYQKRKENKKQKGRVIDDRYVLMEGVKFKSVSCAKIKNKPGRPRKQKLEGMGEE